ncbi:organic hydroperoxide resistance protein [Streptomyces sp. CBMA123]|uniref:organic hydroperoxide resistance protein n=1 Tax=Streptomyces sp. CBMA123 TaxID=1896313 RepID=UPI001661C957|nr:organic hydroperoxide resistance protein [Streptomyces sp. CBMA123]MBD0691519.1 osmotically inducible protein C [Streptomyces sp. CBMA123]
MSDTIYTTTATSWGGRDGKVATDDGRLTASLSMPKELGGDSGPGTNPEQLFAAGYAACFHSGLRLVAGAKKLDVRESAISVTVSMVGSLAEGRLGLAARIEAQLPGVDAEAARELLEATHQVCPYSNATRGNVPVELVLVEEN